MLYCFDCWQSFTRLRDLRKHERIHRRMKHCKPCDVWFTTAVVEKAHILEKHRVSTSCQTEPEQRPQKRAALRSHQSEKCRQHYSQARRPHWRPAWGDERTTPAPTVPSVAVKTETSVLKIPDNYEWMSSSSTTPALFRATNLYQRVVVHSEEEMCKCVDTFYTTYVIALLWKPYIYIRDYIEITMD